MLPSGRRTGLRLAAPMMCFALVVAGVPTVLAATGGSGSLGQAPAMAPGNPDFDAGLKRDRDRLKQRGTAKAKAERKASRQRMRDASRADALKAGRESFPEEFKAPVFDGDQPAPGLDVIDQKGRGTALVEDAKGTKVLLTSSTGLQAKTPSGGFAPVDLSMREGADMFATTNSNSDLEIAKDAEDGVEFADAGFSIATQAAAPASQGVESDDRVFFQGVSEDTGFVVAPRPMGAELGWLIQSPAAPERFVLNVDVPAGGQLRRATTDNPIPGDPPRAIEIANADGKGVGYVYPPLVYDTDGTPVESDFEIEGGDRIAVSVKHRGKDLNFPLFADPEVIIPDAGGISGFPGWRNTQVPAVAQMGNNFYGVARNDCAFYCNGLYLSMPTGTSYDPSGTGARFFYQAPPNTYVYRGILQNMAHSPLVVFGFTFSRWFNGLLGGPTIWEQNVNYQNQAGGLGPNPFGPASNAASGVTHDFCQLPRCTRTGGTEQSALAIGIAAQNDVNSARINTGNLKATVTVNNTSVYLGDRRPPTMSSARPADRDWFNDGAALRTLGTVSASDLGLGLSGVTLSGAASGNGTLGPAACTGDPNRSPCPASFSTAGFSYRLNEGVSTLSLRPKDIVDNQGAAHTWTEKIDRTAPKLTLAADAEEREAVPGTPVDLKLSASDVVAGRDTSGIQSVELRVDGANPDPAKYTKTCTPACPTFEPTFSFDSSPYADGSTINVQFIVRDGAGNITPSDVLDLKVDKRAPEVSLRGPLSPKAQNFSVDRSAYTLTMKATDAPTPPESTGLAGATLKIDGAVADVVDGEVANSCVSDGPRCYTERAFDFEGIDSEELQPDEDGTVPPDVPTLADGLHTFELEVLDVAGNKTVRTWTAGADRTPPVVTLSGPLADLQDQPLAAGTYGLHVAAVDGTVSTRESGVRKIDVIIDGEIVKSANIPCSTDSCAGDLDYTYDTQTQGAGQHTLEVNVTDGADNNAMDGFIVNNTGAQAACQPSLGEMGLGTVGSLVPPVTIGGVTIGLPLLGPSLDQVVQSVNQVLPSALRATQEFFNVDYTYKPSLESAAAGLRSTGSVVKALIGQNVATGITYGTSASAFCVKPVGSSLDAGNAQKVGDSAVYVGAQPQTDIVERPTAVGTSEVLHLRGAQAPQSFSYRVPLLEGQQLRTISPGVVALVTPDPDVIPDNTDVPSDEAPAASPPVEDLELPAEVPETPIPENEFVTTPPPGSSTVGPDDLNRAERQFAVQQEDILAIGQRERVTLWGIFRASWARDAAGRMIPTSLTAQGDTLTLTANHQAPETQYPVTVDRSTTAVPEEATIGYATRAASGKKSFVRARCDVAPDLFGGTKSEKGKAFKPDVYDTVILRGRVKEGSCVAPKNSGARVSRIDIQMCLRRSPAGSNGGYSQFRRCANHKFRVGPKIGPFAGLEALGTKKYVKKTCKPGDAYYRTEGFYTATVSPGRLKTSKFVEASSPYPDKPNEARTNGFQCNESDLWTYRAQHDPRRFDPPNRDKVPSRILGEDLMKSNDPRNKKPYNPGFDAHHIISEKEPRTKTGTAAVKARALGWRCDILANRSRNGAWVRNRLTRAPGEFDKPQGPLYKYLDADGKRPVLHFYLTGNEQYHQAVFTALRSVLASNRTCNRTDALNALNPIKNRILTGDKFP